MCRLLGSLDAKFQGLYLMIICFVALDVMLHIIVVWLYCRCDSINLADYVYDYNVFTYATLNAITSVITVALCGCN